MLKVTTDCSKCIHEKVCKNKNNPKWIKDKLADTQFGKGPNDDYDWDTMSDCYGVDISFSCRHYKLDRSDVDVDDRCMGGGY